MLNSIHTNSGAMIALQALNNTNSDLEKVQKRISTGFRVADSYDDGASFAVAQGLRSTNKGLEAVDERLGNTKGLLSLAQDGLTAVSDTLGSARKVLAKLSDASLSATERTQYNSDYTALRNEVSNTVNQSSFNGTNILLGAATTNVLFNASGGSFALVGQDALGAAFTAGLPATPPATAAAAATLIASGGAFTTYETGVGSSLSTIGGYSRSIDNQKKFVASLSDANVEGIGSIVDADLAKDSARLQSLQIRQQLGTQALSVANQAPSAIVSLFR